MLRAALLLSTSLRRTLVRLTCYSAFISRKDTKFSKQKTQNLNSFFLCVFARPLRLCVKPFLFLTLFNLFTIQSSAQLVDKTPAAVPVAPSIYDREPYEDPFISGINRDASRATAYSFATINDALKGDREKSGRYISLNGDWDFSFALKPLSLIHI